MENVLKCLSTLNEMLFTRSLSPSAGLCEELACQHKDTEADSGGDKLSLKNVLEGGSAQH